MEYRIFTCGCGHKQRISEYQIGLETNCPECKADIQYTLDNTVPTQGEEEAVPVAEAASGFVAPPEEQERHGRDSSDHCARCGRKFRGDWDQHDSPTGLLCNVCANLASADSPATPRMEGSVRPVQTIGVDSEEPPLREREVESDTPPRKSLVDRYPKEVKTAIWIGVALVFSAAIYYSVINPEAAKVDVPVTEERVAEMEEAARNIPGWVITFGNALFIYIATAGTLYATLRMTNRLPHESLAANAVHILFVGFGIVAVQQVLWLVPLVGGILAFILIMYFLWEYYDFDLYAFVMWFVCGILVGVLVWGARILAFGLLANVMRVVT